MSNTEHAFAIPVKHVYPKFAVLSSMNDELLGGQLINVHFMHLCISYKTFRDKNMKQI